MSDKELKVIYPPHLEDGVYVETFRSTWNEEEFKIDFGYFTENEQSDIERINVVSSIRLPAQLLQYLVMQLMRAGMEYEEEYGRLIGFSEEEEEEEEEEEDII